MRHRARLGASRLESDSCGSVTFSKKLMPTPRAATKSEYVTGVPEKGAQVRVNI